MDSPYYSSILNLLPRVFSLIQAEPFSTQYGCADRVYWCWKFTDFPGARYQEIAYTLAWLYQTKPNGDPSTYKAPEILQLCEASIQYWCKIQYKDGSFDEAYPNEKSLAALAFTVFYLSEAYLLLESDLSDATKSMFLISLKSAGNWLLKNDETHGVLSNHLAVASAACLLASRILSSQSLFERHHYFLNRIYKKQDPQEGWLEEYGGADIGYQTHAVFYLARIYELTQSESLLSSLNQSIHFLTHFIHPDGSLGGDYASRNTTFYFPAGFEMLSDKIPSAKSIAHFMRRFIGSPSQVGLAQMDAQNLFPLLNNYAFAHRAFLAQSTSETETNHMQIEQLAFQQEGNWNFQRAGLYVHSTTHYYCVVGLKKGGAISIWSKHSNQLIFQSAGYLWNRTSKKTLSTQSPYSQFTISQNSEFNEVTVNAPFSPIKARVFDPYLFLGFRLFNLTLGRAPRLARIIKKTLVNTLVNQKGHTSFTIKRRFRFHDKSVDFQDSISHGEIKQVKHYPSFSSIHMGSSRYANLQHQQIRGIGFPMAKTQVNSNGLIEFCEVKLT